MARPFQLRTYLLFARLSGPLWKLAMRLRLRCGKEDPARHGEKFGAATVVRPPGTVLWFHALSVGESLALLPLLERAARDLPEAHFLLTTSTLTSARALQRVGLPPRVIHQFLPVDTTRAARRFLDHWQPAIAVISELDLWPALLCAAKKRGLPMLLINSRMSDHNFARRSRSPAMFAHLLDLFDVILAQDDDSRARFARFGVDPARLRVLGALKSAARPLPADAQGLAALRQAIGPRPLWLGAATEAREDAALLLAHKQVIATLPACMMILAPRNPGDADAAETHARRLFDNVARRSRGEMPDPATQVYLADTIGEMGLWYRLAPVSFIGHSLPLDPPALRGKNPFEAAALGSAIVHGPAVVDFAESYAELDSRGAACTVAGADQIGAAILRLQDRGTAARCTQAATALIRSKQAVLDQTWDAIRTRLDAQAGQADP